MARNALIQVRRDTAANWTSVNPTLDSGEFGFETDTGRLKIGDGSTAWTSLRYSSDAYGTTTIRAAATQDGVALAGRAGGTSSYEVTITPTPLGADRTFTLPNVSGTAITTGNLTDITTVGTLPGLVVAGNIAAANTGGQDAIQISPRYGGTNFRTLQLTTAALTASTRVITLPDTNGTVITTGNLSSITAVGTLTGLTSTGTVTINNSSPTILFQDNDNRSAFIHVNNNQFYVLRGDGTNSTTWAQVNGQWPLIINLENNDATFGGTVSAVGSLVAGSKLRAGNVSYQTYDAYAGILFHESYSGAQYQVRVGEFYGESSVGAINGYSFTVYAGNELHLRSRYGATNVITCAAIEYAYIRLYPTTSASTVRDAGFGLMGYFSSRAEIKENIESVSNEDALNRVLNMRPVEFNFKQAAIGTGDNEMVSLDRKRGFIADEMAALDHKLGSWGWINPDNSLRQVELNDDKNVSLEDAVPIYWDHDAVIADLVASIQSLNARLAVLESN